MSFKPFSLPNKVIDLYFHHLPLHRKLMISYGLIIAIPIIVMYFFGYSKMASALETNLLYSANQGYSQAYEFTGYKLYKMLRTSDLISQNDRVHDLLTMTHSKDNYVKEVELTLDLKDYLSSFEDSQDIYRVKLYIPGTRVYASEGTNFLNLRDVPSTKWHPLIARNKLSVLFLSADYLEDTSGQLAIIRPIYDPNTYDLIDGYLRIEFSSAILLDIIGKSDPIIGAHTYITNTRGEMILTSDPLSSMDITATYLDGLSSLPASFGFAEATFLNQEVYLRKQAIPNTDWIMTTLIPKEEVLSVIKRQNYLLLTATFIMTSLALILAYYISRNITSRLDILTTHMKQMDDDTLITGRLTMDQDEIGLLATDYNRMHTKIKGLMDEQYEAGQALKSAELRAIQAQINPHFLYNTLEMINWMAKKQETDKILKVTKELSKFYKLSLNKGEDTITVRDELAHVQAYIAIQNQRFENHIHCHVKLDPEIGGYLLPKILLQPLIENAITHGIMEKDSQEGSLDLQLYTDDHWVYLTIEDDGVGMPKTKLQNLFNPRIHSEKGSHYGLYNIRERLRLYYDHQANILIESQPGQGTKVTIKLPKDFRSR